MKFLTTFVCRKTHQLVRLSIIRGVLFTNVLFYHVCEPISPPRRTAPSPNHRNRVLAISKLPWRVTVVPQATRRPLFCKCRTSHSPNRGRPVSHVRKQKVRSRNPPSISKHGR